MGKKVSVNVDSSKDKNASKVKSGADRVAVVSQYISESEIPRETDVMMEVPVSLIDSKMKDSSGALVSNYTGRDMGHEFLGSSEFLSLKNDIFRNGVRVPIIVRVSTSNDQLVVSDGRCRLTAVRTLLAESHQLNDEVSIKRFLTIPCVIKATQFDRYEEEEVEGLLDEAFLTNFFKRNDSFYSEAWAVGRLNEKGLSLLEIEEQLGKKRSWVKERLNLALCLKDDKFGKAIKDLIENDHETKLSKRVLSITFSKNHFAAKTVEEAYNKLLTIVKGDSANRRAGATKASSYSTKKIDKVLVEVLKEFDSSDVELFVERIREKLSIGDSI